jgi:transcriptional regulator with XRE-family HTH domain
MTQKEGAELCGLKQQAFNRIVNGKEPPYPKRGQRIADALGWNGDWRELFAEIEVA